MNYHVVLLFCFVILILIIFKRFEGFAATSPGTMVQLQTSHVPTEEDVYYYKNVYPKIVAKEIRNMTESDLI
jgi:hypothetical protein